MRFRDNALFRFCSALCVQKISLFSYFARKRVQSLFENLIVEIDKRSFELKDFFIIIEISCRLWPESFGSKANVDRSHLNSLSLIGHACQDPWR